MTKKQINNNIILIGYMGSGKTTIGKILAADLGYDFIDTDALIAEAEGMSIVDIFDSKGEAYFRELEKKCIEHKLPKLTNTVIATGGGLPIYHENIGKLNEIGETFYLFLSPQKLAERIRTYTNRPLLKNMNSDRLLLDYIKSQLDKRHPIYLKAKHKIMAYRDASMIAKRIKQLIIKLSITKEDFSLRSK